MASGVAVATLLLLSLWTVTHSKGVANPPDTEADDLKSLPGFVKRLLQDGSQGTKLLDDDPSKYKVVTRAEKQKLREERRKNRQSKRQRNKTKIQARMLDDEFPMDNPDASLDERLNTCKNGNKFLRNRLKTVKQAYKEKLKAIKRIITMMFEDTLEDPSSPLKDFCTVNNKVVDMAVTDSPLNDDDNVDGKDGADGRDVEPPCVLSPWSEWNTLAFGTLERTRQVLQDGCGCPPEDELTQTIDVLPFLGNNTSEVFTNPGKVGDNFENDFINGNGGSNGGGSNTNGGKGGSSEGNGGSNNGGGGNTNTGGNGGSGSNGGSNNGGGSNNPGNGGSGSNVGQNNGGGGTGTGSNSGGSNNNNNGGGSNNNGGGSNSNGVRDILLILDSSGSIVTDDFDLMKNGVVHMIDLFCGGFGPLRTNNRMAIVQFASNVTVIHRFDESQSPSTLKSKVSTLRHYKGNTCTGNALETSIKEIFRSQRGMRDYTIKDTLIVTDGQSNCGVDIHQASLDLQTSSNVFALGVGIAGKIKARDEVKSVVSLNDPHHIFSLAKFSDFKTMVQNLKARRNFNNPCTPIKEG